MPHSDVSEWRSWTEQVPPVILSFISKPNAKALKKSKTSKKPTASKKVASKKPSASKKSTTSKKAPTLTQRVDSLESKMDKILEILSA